MAHHEMADKMAAIREARNVRQVDQTTQPPDDPPPEILQLFAAGFTAAELHAVADALDFRITFAHEDGPPIRRGDIQWTPKKLAAYRAMAKRNRR